MLDSIYLWMFPFIPLPLQERLFFCATRKQNTNLFNISWDVSLAFCVFCIRHTLWRIQNENCFKKMWTKLAFSLYERSMLSFPLYILTLIKISGNIFVLWNFHFLLYFLKCHSQKTVKPKPNAQHKVATVRYQNIQEDNVNYWWIKNCSSFRV